MNEKKLAIIKAAKKLFTEKGYHNVSMQAIAEACKISKASIYKLFQSKEDLLLALTNFRKEEMLKKGAKINADSSLSPREKLTKKIALEIMEFKENRQWVHLMSDDGSFPNTKVFKKHLRQTKSMIICWHKDSIIQAYGDKVKPFIWDLVMIFHGLMREFYFLVTVKKTKPDIDAIPHFILTVLDLYVEKSIGQKSLLNEEMIASYNSSITPHYPQKEELLASHLQQMKGLITSHVNHKDLLSTVALLEEELFAEEPRMFLIEALLNYLEKIKELQKEISQMKTILRGDVQ
ncbi:TetR/AcrR family transcriptional regulator [Bacillus sp. CLL-7-23]|uniref:TetR/AcrR family transcriptional regulator n=1 Tax=Bacillus changyiensis TaxID=3004103 RepID=A0ABT4X421_9BACI|nr:TetR/AcrR family transcriptional regulator [Bacillus changyiensis]MDA7026489.1 TetR/AcrR family transcriptional regulator [Bacillus changyiensis]